MRDDETTRYFTMMMAVLDMLGCSTLTILAPPHSNCKDVNCLRYDIAKYVNWRGDRIKIQQVGFNSEDMRLFPLGHPEMNLNDKFDVFILFGNHKVPQFGGIGKGINFYVCQFAFDRDRLEKEAAIQTFASYDSIVVNSFHSYTWYSKYIEPYFIRTRSVGLLTPDVHMLPPPVPLLSRPAQTPHFSVINNTVFLSFYGDFFPGQANGGHDVALDVLQRLVKDFSTVHFQLFMMGFNSGIAGTAEYIANIRATIAKQKLPVNFLVNPSGAAVADAVGKSLVFWDMAGIHVADQLDPTVGAVVDTAAIQAMSAGCIVIMQKHGVAMDIVRSGKHGFLAMSPSDYYTHTSWVLHAAHNELDNIRNQAAARAALFSPKHFTTRGERLTRRAMQLEYFHDYARNHIAAVRKRPVAVAPAGSTKQMAVMIVTDFSTTYEFIVRSNMLHLGRGWQLSIWLSEEIFSYFKQVLSDIDNIQFNRLPKHMELDIVAYNVVLKSKWFWDAISAEKVLIFNADSLITRSLPSGFMDFDFIGAPFAVPAQRRQPGFMGLSGSCSIRSVASMREILSADPAAPASEEDEGAYFAKKLAANRKYKLPSAQQAIEFSVRTAYPHVKIYATPFCLNNPWEFISQHNEKDIIRWTELSTEYE
jgi:hypothetical protein